MEKLLIRLVPDGCDLRLGFGCSGPLGKGWFSEAKTAHLVRAALEGGVAHFDTAGFYGEAEARLGAILGETPSSEVFISTKTGTKVAGGGLIKDFSESAMRADVEASLRRLGRERLDLVYLHGPDDDQLAESEALLVRLKEEGKIRFAGVCGDGAGLSAAVAAPFIDVVMGAYNLLRRSHAPIFAEAKRCGKAVVAIEPLAQGLYRNALFAPTSLADVWGLARALTRNRGRLAEARKARAALDIPGWSLGGAALAFSLSNPDIDIAVTTTTKTEHLAESLEAARKALPEAALKRLRGLAPGGIDPRRA